MATNNTIVELPVGLTLEPDYLTLPGQNFALVSFVGPEFCRQKSGQFAMKVRGCFATEEEAKAYVKRLQRSGDNVVDIFPWPCTTGFLALPTRWPCRVRSTRSSSCRT